MYRLISALLIVVTLSSCASSRVLHDHAVVDSYEKVEDPSVAPSTGTLVGATSGLGTGLLVGGIVGTTICAVISAAVFFIGVPACAGFVASGLAIGGGVGLAVGGTSGYIYDRIAAGSGVYKYTVIVQGEKQPVTVYQVQGDPMKVGQAVQVLIEKDGVTKIKPL